MMAVMLDYIQRFDEDPIKIKVTIDRTWSNMDFIGRSSADNSKVKRPIRHLS